MAKTEESEQITLEDNVYKNHTIIAKYEAVLVSAEPMGWRAQVGYFKTDKDGKPVSEKRTIDVVLNGPGLSKAARKIAGQVYLMASRE